MQSIKLGPAGLGGFKEAPENLKKFSNLKLKVVEIAFTYGVYLDNKKSEEIGKIAKDLDIMLTIHAPYWINLASEDKKKIEQSKKRILDCCERAHYLNAKYVVFHPGYYNKKEDTFNLIKKEILDLMKTIKKNKWKVELAPETTGRVSAFFSLDEAIEMQKKVKCHLCVDAAHIYARNNGKIDYKEVFDKLEKLKFKHYHFHFSGINYSEKGERNHLTLSQGGPPFEPFAREILKRKFNATIISESPITWKDSLKMQKIFKNLGYKF